MENIEYDVVVVGGGISGALSAVAAARNGAKTLVIDQYGYFGGALTANGVGPMMTFFAGEKQVIKGLGQEMIDRLIAYGYSPGHVRDSTNYISYLTPFDAEGLKTVLDEMVIESGANILFHTFLIGAEVEEKKIKKIQLANKDGITWIKAKMFIDASGDGDLSKLANVPYKMGRKTDNATQPMTMNLKIYNVDIETIKETIQKESEKFERINRDLSSLNRAQRLSFVGFAEELRKAKESGEVTVPREDILFFETNNPGEIILNTSRIINKSGVDAKGISEAEVIGRKQCMELYRFLVKYIPGFEQAKIAFTGPNVGVRGTRQIVGKYTLTENDILTKKKFTDVIAHTGYPIDIHNPAGEGTVSVHSNMTEEIVNEAFDKNMFDHFYSIPFKVMVTDVIDNLIVTGRCVSATFEAQAGIRTTPTMTALGQAAGTAAAMLVESQDVNQLDISDLQATLVKDQAFLELSNS